MTEAMFGTVITIISSLGHVTVYPFTRKFNLSNNKPEYGVLLIGYILLQMKKPVVMIKGDLELVMKQLIEEHNCKNVGLNPII